MGLHLAVAPVPCVDARYEGPVSIQTRLEAKERMAASAKDLGIDRVLIDLTRADVEPYGPKEALQVTRKVASLAQLRRLAYVIPAVREDMIASVLAATHGRDFVSVFEDRQSALDWLASAC